MNEINNTTYTYTHTYKAKINKKEKHPLNVFFKNFNVFKFIQTQIGKQIAKILFNVKIKNDISRFNSNCKKELTESNKIESFQINAKNVNLDGIIIKPETPSNKYIVVFNGINDCYDNHLASLNKLANDVQANVVTFDYRGVNKSKGLLHSKNHLIKDGTLVLEFLENKKIEKNNILIYGHSFGGAVAALVHERTKHPGPLVSEASFSTFENALSARGRFIEIAIIKIFNWNLEPVKAFKNIKTKIIIILTERDPIVRKLASLHKALKNKIYTEDEIDYELIKIGKKINTESSDITDKDERELKKKYMGIKKAKLFDFLHNPHDRVMDRVFYDEKEASMTDYNLDVLNDLTCLKTIFKEDDIKAYKQMVTHMKTSLNIPLSQ